MKFCLILAFSEETSKHKTKWRDHSWRNPVFIMCISSPQRRKHPMRRTKYILHVNELPHSCSRNDLLNILLQKVPSAALRGEVLNWESQKPVPVPSSQPSADYSGKFTDNKSSPAFCISLITICNFHLWCWLPKHSKYFLA